MDAILNKLDYCMETARMLELTVHQDCADMAACTKGQLLTEYRSEMDWAAQRLKRISAELSIYYSEYLLLQ